MHDKDKNLVHKEHLLNFFDALVSLELVICDAGNTLLDVLFE